MFEFLKKILTTTNPHLIKMKIVIILAILLLSTLSYRFIYPKNKEGFKQGEPFILKRNNNAQDMFYIELYDKLNNINKIANEDLIHIIKTTSPSAKHSVFLDAGCGTGEIVNELTEAGYSAYGIDNCENMVSYSKMKYPNLEVLNGDILQPMMFEKNTFTHILCTYFTIYNINNKQQFINNCYHWLQPGGYLVLHLVDKYNFKNIIPNEDAVISNENLHNKFILRNKVIFTDYEYKGSIELLKNSNNATKIETFTDINTHNVRQNETDIYMEDITDILNMVKNTGFIYHAKTIISNDTKQYLYYFEKTM